MPCLTSPQYGGGQVLQAVIGGGGGWGGLYHLSSSCLLWGVTLLYALLPQAKLKSFSAKIVQLLKEWTEAFPYDFQDEKAMAELKAITHRVTQCDEVRSSLDSGRSSWVYDWGRGFTLTEGWVFRDSSLLVFCAVTVPR